MGETNGVKCVVAQCHGSIDFSKEIPVGDRVGYACDVCGRLHTETALGMRSDDSRKLRAFYEGVVSYRDGTDYFTHSVSLPAQQS